MGRTPSRTQVHLPTRMEALERDYARDRITIEQLEAAAECLIRLDVADSYCPFHPKHGLGWWYGLTPDTELLLRPGPDRIRRVLG